MANTQVPSELIATNAISGTIIADNAITSVHIAQNQVTAVQIPDGSITATQIAADAVGATELAASSVVTASIQDDQVTGDKLANNIQIAGTLGVTGVISPTTHIDMPDDAYLKIGTGDDLQIYHNASDSIIRDAGTGRLLVGASEFLVTNSGLSEAQIQSLEDGAVTLYHNGNAKLATASDGVDITGTLDVSGAATVSSINASGGYLNGANGGIRIHSGGTKFFNVTAANAARDNHMDIGASDARFKDLYLGGSITAGDAQISKAGNGNSPILHVTDTADTEVAWFEGNRAGDTGAFIAVRHNPSTPQGTNRAGIKFQADDDGGNVTNYAQMTMFIDDQTNGSEDGQVQIAVSADGTLEEKVRIDADLMRFRGDAGSSFIRADNRADGHDTGFEIYQNNSRKWEIVSDDSNTDALDIRNNGGGSKFTFTQAGELGIGYTNPGAFHANYRNLVVGSGSGDEGMIIYSGAGSAGAIAFARDAAGNSDSYDGYIEYNQADRSMRFAANAGGERMRLNNTGLGIGTGSPSTKLYVYNQGGGNGDCMTVQSGSTANANVGMILFRDNDQDYCGQITSNGSTNTTIFNTNSSDERLKENITDWEVDALSLFKNIEPKEFNFKSQDEGAPKVRGYIAQTEASKFPEAFTTDTSEEAYYSYNPSGMVIYLMKALKEQVAINEALEARITALEK